MMRKLIQIKPIMTILILLFVFCMILNGCSNTADVESESNSKINTAVSSNMVKSLDSASSTASGSNAESNADDKAPSQNYSINISEDEAIELALTEAKSHQKEFLCTITDADIKTAKCELKSDNNNIYYAVVFHVPLSESPNFLVDVGVDVDADSGKIIDVHQFK